MPDAWSRPSSSCRGRGRGPSPRPGSTTGWRSARGDPADAGLGAGRLRQDHAARQPGWRRGGAAGRPPGSRSTSATGTPTSFWTYVLLAVDRAAAGHGAGGARPAASPGQAPVDAVLTDAAQRAQRAARRTSTLVLDDYHLAEGPEVQPGMAFLLDHLPPQVHARHQHPRRPRPAARPAARPRASSSRSGPPTCASPTTRRPPTSTTSTASTSTADDVAALEARTEGWIAALQLAALSLQGRDDPVAVHRRVRRRRPVRRRLPRRRGARPPAARRAATSCSTPRSSTG